MYVPAPTTPRYLIPAPPLQYVALPPSAPSAPVPTAPPTWDQAAFISAMNAYTNTADGGWIADFGATAHMSGNPGLLSSGHPASSFPPIIVGNGITLPVTHIGHSHFTSDHKPLHLRNVLVAPNLVANLLSVRRFTTNNNVSTEFDPFGLSVKDLATQDLIVRHDSLGDLYPFPGVLPSLPQSNSAFVASVNLWHQRLGHPNRRLVSSLLQ